MKNILTLILLGFSVGLGNFAAAVALGISGVDKTLRKKVALVFGLFETVMPIIGLIIGRQLASFLGGKANLIGGTLLVLTGFYELYSAYKTADVKEVHAALGSWQKLTLAAIALSIDNLIIGFSLGAYKEPIILSAVVIGATCVVMSLVGLEIGNKLSSKAEKYSEQLSGYILIAVGLAVMFQLI